MRSTMFSEETKLARALRRLPSPEIPRELEGRLLAAIGSEPSAPVLRRRVWPMIVGAGAIAACLTFAVITYHRTRTRVHRIDVSPRYVLQSSRTEGPRPCDILPPLPRSW